MRYPERVTRVFAFGANTSTSGLKDGFETNPTFAAFLARARREYARLSATPRQYTAFHDQIGKMWENQPNRSDAQPREIRTSVGWWTASTTRASSGSIPTISPQRFQAP
jgi:hypothetical protein